MKFGLVSQKQDTRWEGRYPSAESQSAYSTATTQQPTGHDLYKEKHSWTPIHKNNFIW